MAFEADWPAGDSEEVPHCPYCGNSERSLAYSAVRDWAFGSAPGLWTYWSCSGCHGLYLSPRPTPASIGNAYSRYYTHDGDRSAGRLSAIKKRVRNEVWSYSLQTSLYPRLGLPKILAWTTQWLRPWIAEPFGLRQLAQLPKGLLIDVGCGNGNKIKLAEQLGWQARGIELDAAAVKAAVAQGLQVELGGFELLANYEGQVDCLVCSHVLEHVHQPLRMIELLLAALKPEGVLLLSLPNAASFLRHHYRENWRGLEAPRHLAIPDGAWLRAYLGRQGFDCTQVPSHPLETAIESERMRRRGANVVAADIHAAKALLRGRPQPAMAQQDVTQLVCVRAAT